MALRKLTCNAVGRAERATEPERAWTRIHCQAPKVSRKVDAGGASKCPHRKKDVWRAVCPCWLLERSVSIGRRRWGRRLGVSCCGNGVCRREPLKCEPGAEVQHSSCPTAHVMAVSWLGARLGVCDGESLQSASMALGVLGPAAARLNSTGPIMIYTDQRWAARRRAFSPRPSTRRSRHLPPSRLLTHSPKRPCSLCIAEARGAHVEAPMHATGLPGARCGECQPTSWSVKSRLLTGHCS